MRKRFRVDRICSSDNYNLSKKYHVEFLRESHNANSVLLKKYQAIKVEYKGIPHVKCFGKLVQISLQEAESLESITHVIWIL